MGRCLFTMSFTLTLVQCFSAVQTGVKLENLLFILVTIMVVVGPSLWFNMTSTQMTSRDQRKSRRRSKNERDEATGSIPSCFQRHTRLKSHSEWYQLHLQSPHPHRGTSKSSVERGILHPTPQRCNVSVFTIHRFVLSPLTTVRSTALTEFTLNISTSLGHIPVPSAGLLTLNGRESKIIVTDYAFGESASKVLYSTAESVSPSCYFKTS